MSASICRNGPSASIEPAGNHARGGNAYTKVCEMLC